MDIWDKYKSVPKEYTKKIEAGRIKGFTSINPMWRIKSLTEEYGKCGFGWKIANVQFVNTLVQNGEINVRCTLELFVKEHDVWSDAIFGAGGSKISAMEKNGLFVSDEAEKMAVTDAISSACKLLGFGADIYLGEDESNKYSKPKEKGTIDVDNYTKYKSWLDGLELINDIDELKVYYLDHIKKIEADSFLMDLFANKKAKLSK